MMLKNVHIKNFRCFEDISFDLGETTVLIRENNTRKTSILDALRLALPFPSIDTAPMPDEYNFHLSDAKEQPYHTGELSITLDFTTDGGESDYLDRDFLGKVTVYDDKRVAQRMNS
ncbi:MAG: AAA family ATPase [Desulfovibrio sp.]|nr:AAA family ATPase [Desulfovibrio sp.]